jgi:general secretion pathway protein N
MRATTLVALVGIPAYALFMVLAAPATFIANRAAAASDGRVHFSDARGTVWSGSVRARYDGTGGSFACDRVAWRLMPAKLVEARIAFDVEADCPDAQARVQVARGWSEWEASGGSARMAARSLAAFFPMVAAWRPEGSISVTADGLRWNEREMQGPITLEWRDAAVALSDVRPLGTYRITAQGAGDTAKLALSTVAGALRMTGQGELKLPRGVTFSGEARGEGAANAAALEPLLNLMGPRRPDGARPIEVRIR